MLQFPTSPENMGRDIIYFISLTTIRNITTGVTYKSIKKTNVPLLRCEKINATTFFAQGCYRNACYPTIYPGLINRHLRFFLRVFFPRQASAISYDRVCGFSRNQTWTCFL